MSDESPAQKTNIEALAATDTKMEESERHEWWMANNPVNEISPQNSPGVCAERVAECDAMMDSFEATHNLDALRVITRFASVEERLSSIRQPALEALTPLFKQLKYLKSQEAVQREACDALIARYDMLRQAVGNTVEDVTVEDCNVLIVTHDLKRSPRPTKWSLKLK